MVEQRQSSVDSLFDVDVFRKMDRAVEDALDPEVVGHSLERLFLTKLGPIGPDSVVASFLKGAARLAALVQVKQLQELRDVQAQIRKLAHGTEETKAVAEEAKAVAEATRRELWKIKAEGELSDILWEANLPEICPRCGTEFLYGDVEDED